MYEDEFYIIIIIKLAGHGGYNFATYCLVKTITGV